MQCYPRAGAARFPLAFREKERVDSWEGKARICIYIERGKEPQKPRETTWGQYREKPLGSRSYLCLVTVWSSPSSAI